MCKKCRQEYKNRWARTTEKGKGCQKRWRTKGSTKKYIREFMSEWRKTEKGKIYLEKLYKHPNEKRKESIRRFQKTEKWRAYKKLYDRIWAKTEKGKTASNKHTVKRRALKSGNTQILFMLTNQQWETLLNRFNFLCAYCGKDIHFDPTQDHVIPLSKGGPHTIDNVVPACRRCNSSKHDNIWEPNRQWIN